MSISGAALTEAFYGSLEGGRGAGRVTHGPIFGGILLSGKKAAMARYQS